MDKFGNGIKTGKWGPYNKDYLGLTHIANEKKGMSFNLEFFPGIYRRTICSKKAIADDGAKMWDANNDLTNFTYRYELEWKDRLYCDINYNITKDEVVDISCNFVNNTDLPQNVSLDCVFSMDYPLKRFGMDTIGFKKVYDAVLAQDTYYLDAVEYSEIKCSQAYSVRGLILGEAEYPDATGKGTLISEKYFGNTGDYVAYHIKNTKCNSIGIRYFAKQGNTLTLVINNKKIPVYLPPDQDFVYQVVGFEYQDIKDIEILSGGVPVNIDCIIYGIDCQNVFFENANKSVMPNILMKEDCAYIKYQNVETEYKLQFGKEYNISRYFYTNEIGDLLAKNLHNTLETHIYGADRGERVFKSYYYGPLCIEPKNNFKLHFRLTSGEFLPEEEQCGKDVKCIREGSKYLFSQKMLRNTTLLNVVYPMYSQKEYVKVTTPGRLWDWLYQWDNGFIGLGLATMDFDRAFECLTTFLCDKQTPFVVAGTVLPTQILLYDYLFNCYEDKRQKLYDIYPDILKVYMFFSDLKTESHQMKTGLLKLWHIFYNSGGWDDYPPQKAINNMFDSVSNPEGATQENTTPVITTAFTVLIAKILKRIAEYFGESTKIYEDDIKYFNDALQKYAYDNQSGYFQYVVHDSQGNFKHFFHDKDGNLFNSGMDGIYPYIADITTEEQNKKIIDNIRNGMMTNYGVSAVDLRADYYSSQGYWNGAVWFPHQYILWKSLLDHNQTDLATEIAQKALNVWKNEMDESYSSSENFSVKTGRGCGYHLFSGLSTPPLLWFKSYYVMGEVTGGFMTTVSDKQAEDDCKNLCFKYRGGSTILVCLNDKYEYIFTVNGKPVIPEKVNDGTYYITLADDEGIVIITGK